jgi:hypothetical protein
MIKLFTLIKTMSKNNIGIVESFKKANTEKEIKDLQNKLDSYDQASSKTLKKCAKIIARYKKIVKDRSKRK